MGKKSNRQKDQEFANYMTNAVRRTWAFCQSMVPSGKSPNERDMMVYDILLNAIVNIENNMRKKGQEPPQNFIQDHVGAKVRSGRSLESNYVMCKRCEFNKKDADGLRYCSVFRWNVDSSRYYTAQDDGCSRGLLKEAYR